MTQSADMEAAAELVVPAGVLNEGEVVILAVKPSGWFVAMVSWPVLAMVALAAAALLVAQKMGLPVARDWTLAICAGVMAARLLVACGQWLGRLYVLTDRRILRVRSLGRMAVAGWALADVRQVQLIAGRGEQQLGIASLAVTASDGPAEIAWLYIPRPLEVQRIVFETLQQTRR